ncbi:MFS transporter, partial [Leucobacter sp. M11]|uniref:MFS transporter n=1 Tax=Leucobacter sp. M11 TaxID=2993565 RepID=UPI002D811524
AAGNIFFEFASVNYNAMLTQVSTPATIGRVSGFGWGMGYLGGIVLLGIILVGFVFPEVGWFGVTADNGLNIRVAMLVAAAWFGLSAIPVLIAVPEVPRAPGGGAKLGIIGSYRALFGRIAQLARTAPNTLRFLVASAVFRDGLAGVFTFGGIIAARSFGFDSTTVIIFAIAANVVAGIATVALGLVDDRLGARFLMISSLSGMLVVAAFLFFLAPLGTWVFWVFGLALCVFVGPVQSASRSYLARMIPKGQESEIFGLYATTGRAVSFLAPAAFALFVDLSGQTITGIIGIALVIAVGLGLLLWVRPQSTARLQ